MQRPGWELQGGWSSKPAFILYWIGYESERIVSCYWSREGKTTQITQIEPDSLIIDNKALIDAYLYVALKGLILEADKSRMKRLIVDSYIPSIVDHMLDLGFSITAKGLSMPGGRGCKILEG